MSLRVFGSFGEKALQNNTLAIQSGYSCTHSPGHDPMVCSVGTDTRDRYSANYSLSLKFETVDLK